MQIITTEKTPRQLLGPFISKNFESISTAEKKRHVDNFWIKKKVSNFWSFFISKIFGAVHYPKKRHVENFGIMEMVIDFW